MHVRPIPKGPGAIDLPMPDDAALQRWRRQRLRDDVGQLVFRRRLKRDRLASLRRAVGEVRVKMDVLRMLPIAHFTDSVHAVLSSPVGGGPFLGKPSPSQATKVDDCVHGSDRGRYSERGELEKSHPPCTESCQSGVDELVPEAPVAALDHWHAGRVLSFRGRSVMSRAYSTERRKWR